MPAITLILHHATPFPSNSDLPRIYKFIASTVVSGPPTRFSS